jgi:hypothetical protein
MQIRDLRVRAGIAAIHLAAEANIPETIPPINLGGAGR